MIEMISLTGKQVFVLKAFPGHGGRPGMRGGSSAGPSTPQEHETRIARDTLKMPDAMAGVMGGPSKEEAASKLGKYAKQRHDFHERNRQVLANKSASNGVEDQSGPGSKGESEEEKAWSVETNKDRKENPAKKMRKSFDQASYSGPDIGGIRDHPHSGRPGMRGGSAPGGGRKLDSDARDQVRRAKLHASGGHQHSGLQDHEADDILRRHTGQGMEAYKGFRIVVKLSKALPHPHKGRPGQRGGSSKGSGGAELDEISRQRYESNIRNPGKPKILSDEERAEWDEREKRERGE